MYSNIKQQSSTVQNRNYFCPNLIVTWNHTLLNCLIISTGVGALLQLLEQKNYVKISVYLMEQQSFLVKSLPLPEVPPVSKAKGKKCIQETSQAKCKFFLQLSLLLTENHRGYLPTSQLMTPAFCIRNTFYESSSNDTSWILMRKCVSSSQVPYREYLKLE